MNTSYLGAAYYPELWSEDIIDRDISLMKEAGITLVRIGEFAWSKSEPKMDQFDFSWLHHNIDKLYSNGIMVILGTPTATPPIWFTNEFPDALHVDKNGYKAQHGAREHCCAGNAAFINRSRIIVQKLAQEFAEHPAIIGWQIDNEICRIDKGCFCESCKLKFKAWLEDKYTTISEYNERLNLERWSLSYSSFQQIMPPEERTWNHPSLITDWLLFHSHSIADYVSMQAVTLKENGVKVPIGTDMMPILDQNYIETNLNTDVIQFNHYTAEDKLYSVPFWMSYARTLKNKPFWNTETSTCWMGATEPSGYKVKGFCKVNTWLSFAFGAEVNLYWLWRAHRTGQELMHGSVISSAGRPLHIFDEVKEVASGIRKTNHYLSHTNVRKSNIAIHMSHLSDMIFKGQNLVAELRNWGTYPRLVCDAVFKPLLEAQFLPDVIDTAINPEGYKVVISPFIPCFDEDGFTEKMLDWVKKGGIWIVGPLSDIRNIDGSKYIHSPFGRLEEIAGVYCKYQLPVNTQKFTAKFMNNQIFESSVWCDAFEVKKGTESLAKYCEYPIEGLTAISFKQIGEGGIVVLGTLPDPKAFSDLVKSIFKKAKIDLVACASENVIVIPRENGEANVCICIEYLNKAGMFKNSKKVINLLNDKVFTADIKIEPYEVLVLKEI